ncbi:MAG: hypothetical protein BRC41_00740 [Cyanobacteria bacterium QH_9_48_43]|jgi:uncharacterized integral membrane protein|nr:MAG: hypothetical protein BRC36_16150 [Cyanobacteria bacterium QH_2_48_84]PSO60536.1 MAG: hypothetical protein BRC35_01530 [Cyanobacteria bacterium QH_10_48_56]PSO61839.1 MAG: hypothetical protein BRC39_07130 [Cyanobacteria bacterium QH_7_48_89]PSO71187.1 MAG: hypothetical protein BRC42_08395 [Cyanobacteria bacterium QS_1_48_34]PSO72515.1 MAG: hypothetical protein BRC37_11505 [Cyanobacteria bacterium QH_3_48_40]PSO78466.1 MAG: hypothetical protein BRC44_10860 [Cyanobacteria bacterium QS_4_4
MPKLKIALLLLVLGGLLLFLLQNWSPVLPLVILGSQTIGLPLAAWILLAVGAGFLTSLVLQLLNFLSRRGASRRVDNSQAKSQLPRTPSQEPFNTSESSQNYNYTPSSASKASKTAAADWETGDDDWEIETPPNEPTGQSLDRSSSEYEVESREPKSSYNSGSVYSYTYRESKQPQKKGTESVYDANYRVIRAPQRNLDEEDEETEEDEEDWGLDEDDEFEEDNSNNRFRW